MGKAIPGKPLRNPDFDKIRYLYSVTHPPSVLLSMRSVYVARSFALWVRPGYSLAPLPPHLPERTSCILTFRREE